jgi:hypothetical protein
MTGSPDESIQPQFRTIDGLSIRFAESKLDIIDSAHFTWEDAADEYAALVTSWWAGGYTTV